eukprot:SAG31_NODE_4700_length_3024_cov_2.572308_3_plen_96_part_00
MINVEAVAGCGGLCVWPTIFATQPAMSFYIATALSALGFCHYLPSSLDEHSLATEAAASVARRRPQQRDGREGGEELGASTSLCNECALGTKCVQ